MRNETIGRLAGGFLGALLIAVGMMAFTPQIGSAQGPGQPPPGGRRGGGPGIGRGGPGGPMAMAGIDPRDLTDAQREQIKAIRERHAADMKPVMDRVQS